MSVAKRSLNVGVVGLGNMGLPIARNLAFKGRSSLYLQLHSRTIRKARQISDDLGVDGATCAMRLHDRYSTVTKWCDIVLCSLADQAASRAVLLENDEALLTHARPGQIIVDHTTVDVELSRECAAVAAERGAFFLDAPMSGSPRAVFNGQLVLMVGGPAEYYQRMLPMFRMYADTIHHLGDNGAGSATKLISQALVASHNAAAAEAMTIANRLGVEDQSKLIQVLDASWGSSTMLRRNAPTMQDLIRNPDKLPPSSGATVDRLLHDLSLLDASLPKLPSRHGGEAQEEEEKFPVLDTSLCMLGAAAEAGMGDRDVASVVHFIQAGAQKIVEERAVDDAESSASSSSSSFFGGSSSTVGSGALQFGGLSSGAFTRPEEDVESQKEKTKTDAPPQEFGSEDFY